MGNIKVRGWEIIATKDTLQCTCVPLQGNNGLFAWLVADGWCWFVLREKYCWLIAGG
jgi:hypothetical protein